MRRKEKKLGGKEERKQKRKWEGSRGR